MPSVTVEATQAAPPGSAPPVRRPVSVGTPEAVAGAAESANCYHCGQPLPPGQPVFSLALGIRRPMCCAGCASVAQAIVESGLGDYYAKRDQFAGAPREPVPEVFPDLKVFDREEIQCEFVTVPAEHERETALILEGISCPACIWLNETHLARQPGVLAAGINYTTRRARVRWDDRLTRLSDIIAAIQAIGYRAYPYDPGAMEASRVRERRDALLRLAVAGLGMMQVMMYAFPAYVSADGDMPADAAALMRWASLVLTFPVVAYSSMPFFRGALRDLRARRAGMDVPVALGIGVAFIASAVATLAGRGPVYFDSVAMFVFFLLGARYLELRARHQATGYLEFLGRSMPAVAHKFRSASEETEAVPVGALSPGDEVLVRPGEAFPADGRLVQGSTEVDESLLTGESLPQRRSAGDEVIGGAVNRGDPVRMRVIRIGADTLLSGIVRLMERGSAERPRLQVLADRVGGRFVAFVLVATAAAALFWMWAEPANVLPVAVSVLVVTCPCALALATPMVTAVAHAAIARQGIIVTRGEALETLASATHFIFDKTGTLTEGRLRVARVDVLGRLDHGRIIAIAAALERHSEHPLGRAIAEIQTAPRLSAVDVSHHAGRGIEGWVEGQRLRIGQRAFVAEIAHDRTRTSVAPTESTAVWLGDERGPLARLLLDDKVREEASVLVAKLRQAGRFVMLMSGDGQHVVRKAAAQTGILYWRARMLPDQKQATVRDLQEQGAVVAMVGDGVNDVPVLAQAQVSIAMGTGAALAQQAADLVLVSGRLGDIDRGYRLACKARRIMRQNLVWAFAYNVVALPLAMAGWLTPWLAGAGMSASSLLVVLNALRARRV